MPRVLNIRCISAILGVALISCFAALSLRARTFESWLNRVQRPGYTLLFKQETPSYYFAVFDAGGSQMAICDKVLRDTDSASPTSYAVFDMHGDDLMDLSLPDRFDELNRDQHFLLFNIFRRDGVMYPIEQDYRGDVRVTVKNEADSILDVTVPWNATSLP